ncbi:MAG: alpha-ketoacid dehydrogenase subunit beta [Chloroflexi bacterium]|nr:alpha-ketoacid dehydrogenase subunit beta [Chloroflexota bacterium]
MSTDNTDTNQRILTYPEAVREATLQEMERDDGVIVMGIGVDDPKAIYGTTAGLQERFGEDRVFDTPLSEDGMTGMAIGAAQMGLRPIHVHIRMDFVLLAMNQLINVAAKNLYTFGGAAPVPIVVRSYIGRSWGQGPQHSQALHSMFMHVPGLRVVAPSNPYDAKGALIASIRDNNPVMFVEHRLLSDSTSHVPEEPYALPFGKARVQQQGSDITIIGISYMAVEAYRAAQYLKEVGVSAEVIDPVSLSPLDLETILASVAKTGRLLVVDNGWLTCGASAEILASVAENVESPVSLKRMGFAPVTCPTTPGLEQGFYPNAQTIAVMANQMVQGKSADWVPDEIGATEATEFRGPF